jgi:hypothetical protein
MDRPSAIGGDMGQPPASHKLIQDERRAIAQEMRTIHQDNSRPAVARTFDGGDTFVDGGLVALIEPAGSRVRWHENVLDAREAAPFPEREDAKLAEIQWGGRLHAGKIMPRSASTSA